MAEKSSKQVRKLVDMIDLSEDIERAAIADSVKDDTLYTFPDYVREIVQGFLLAKKENPELTPKSFKSHTCSC